MIIILFCVFVLSNGMIFEGSCPEVEEQDDFPEAYGSYKVTLLMSGFLSRNHIFRNIFGHCPDCWTFSLVNSIRIEDISEIWFQRNRNSYELFERSSCFNIFSVEDVISAEIGENRTTFKTMSKKIYFGKLPMWCSNNLNWKSKFHTKAYSVRSEGFSGKEITYVVLWSCENLPNGYYDLGIIAGVDSLIEYNWEVYYLIRLEILENSLNLIRRLPFAGNFSIDDFQRAKLHDGIFCDLCEVFRCK